MKGPVDRPHVAFAGDRLLARGSLQDVALAVHRHLDGHDLADAGLFVFDETAGRLTDLDLRGSAEAVQARYAATSTGVDEARGETPVARRRGRPKLGVVGREVTLLPRHWEWLDGQRGGASAALRRLVDGARKSASGVDRAHRAQDATHRLMTALAGNHPGFEEACRALYAGDAARFRMEVAPWPADLKRVLEDLAADVWQQTLPAAGP